jgi:hypothetical protein
MVTMPMHDTLLNVGHGQDIGFTKGLHRHVVWQSAALSPSVSDAELDKAVSDVEYDDIYQWNLLAPEHHCLYISYCALWFAYALALVAVRLATLIDSVHFVQAGTILIGFFCLEVAAVVALRGSRKAFKNARGRFDLVCLLWFAAVMGIAVSRQLIAARLDDIEIVTVSMLAIRYALPLGRRGVTAYSTARSVRISDPKEGSIAFDTDFDPPSLISSAATTPRNYPELQEEA